MEVFLLFQLKGLNRAKIIKKLVIYFGFLIWPYDVNMSVDLNCKSFKFIVLRIYQLG